MPDAGNEEVKKFKMHDGGRSRILTLWRQRGEFSWSNDDKTQELGDNDTAGHAQLATSKCVSTPLRMEGKGK